MTSVIALFALLNITACSADPGHVSNSGDHATYDTAKSLTGDADAVVTGTIGERIGSELDNGGNPELDDEGHASGDPLVFYRFNVIRTLKGTIAPIITIAWLDASKDDRPVSALGTGQHVALFLQHLDEETAPGVELTHDFYVPVSGDNGVMDVDGSTWTARSEDLTGFASPGRHGVRLVTTEQDVTTLISSLRRDNQGGS